MKRMSGMRGIGAVLFLGFASLAGASHRATGQIPQLPRIQVRLVDFAGLPSKVRARAEELVVQIFRKAGLEIDFIEDTLAGDDHLWLQILKQPLRNLQADTAGFAVLTHSPVRSDSYAAVCYPLVQAAARELDAAESEVLGASMAHELGHLLLRSKEHSRTGVMSPRIDRRQIDQLERGEWRFTADQASRLSWLRDR